MADDVVRNRVAAVRDLRKGILRYAEQIRDAVSHVRRDVVTLQRKADAVVEARRSTLKRAERELSEARAALARCSENCGGLQERVRVATHWHADATRDLDRARRAVQLVASVQAELATVLQRTEASVAEQSSAGSAALAGLESKLAGLVHGTGRDFANKAIVTGVVGLEILGATASLGRVAGNSLQAVGIDTPLRDHSVTEMVDRDDHQQEDYVHEQTAERQAREGEEMTP